MKLKCNTHSSTKYKYTVVIRMVQIIVIYFIRNTQDLKLKADARNVNDDNNSRCKYLIYNTICSYVVQCVYSLCTIKLGSI